MTFPLSWHSCVPVVLDVVRGGYGLVQATAGVGAVSIWAFSTAQTRGGGGGGGEWSEGPDPSLSASPLRTGGGGGGQEAGPSGPPREPPRRAHAVPSGPLAGPGVVATVTDTGGRGQKTSLCA